MWRDSTNPVSRAFLRFGLAQESSYRSEYARSARSYSLTDKAAKYVLHFLPNTFPYTLLLSFGHRKPRVVQFSSPLKKRVLSD
jgi:hypothetical protein